MADQTAPDGGVSSTQTAPTGASTTGSPEVPAGTPAGDKQTPDLFNAGYSKAAEKFEAQLKAATDKATKLEAEFEAAKRDGLNADELRKLAEDSSTQAKSLQETHNKYKSSVSSYFENRLKELPEDLQAVMQAVDSSDFDKYVKALEGCERMVKTDKPPSQGGALPTGTTVSEAFTQYQAARKSNDVVKLRALMADPTKKAEILQGLAAQQ